MDEFLFNLNIDKGFPTKIRNPPGLVWLNWLGVIPQSERSLVRFLVKTGA